MKKITSRINSFKETPDIKESHTARYQFASQFVRNKVVLDLACGIGYGSEILLKKGKADKIIAADVSQGAIKKAKENYNHEKIEFKKMNAEEINLPSNSVDVVVSLETIEHLKSPNLFLGEIRKVLKEDGLLVVSTPNKLQTRENNPYHEKEFIKNEFKKILKKYFRNVIFYFQQNKALTQLIANGESNNFLEHRINKKYLERLPKDCDSFLVICSQREVKEKVEEIAKTYSSATEVIYDSTSWKLGHGIIKLLKFPIRIFKRFIKMKNS